jgi:ATP-dependent DNA helicase RecG
MLYRADQVLKMLPLLDEQIADDLESESLDFKECPDENRLRELAREMAVCFVNNGSGGTVVFGVKDRVKGRAHAVVGVDFAPDLDQLKRHLYDTIEPKLLVQFEWLSVDAVRLLLMYAEPTLPTIYTTSSGGAKIRVGKDCMPLTGSVRMQALEKLGAADITARIVPLDNPMTAVSPGALEILRREMLNLDVPRDLLAYPDAQLCEKLGVLREGQLTFAGLLLVGRPEAIAEHAPTYEWQYTRMRSDTDYDVPPLRGNESLVVALDKIMLAIGQSNPITTVPAGLFHAEFPQYPTIALREAILNAFAHRSYTTGR